MLFAETISPEIPENSVKSNRLTRLGALYSQGVMLVIL